jgi:GntR family transcriptional regulator, transcriptional repressor for pyruvate dehydrogenase complex
MLTARRIVRDIVQSRMSQGDRLAQEHEMCQKYQVGAGTLHEALRVLEFHGVITFKRGPHGGPVLTSPATSELSSVLLLLLQLNRAELRTIIDGRLAFEPEVSRLAASRITADQLNELERSIWAMRNSIDDLGSFLAADRAFHEIVAASSGNVLFGHLVASMFNILDDSLVAISHPLLRRRAVVLAHQNIYDALADGDPTRAEEWMRRDVEADICHAEQACPEVFGQLVTWGVPDDLSA